MALAVFAAAPARGDSIETARVALDLTDPSRVGWTSEIVWTVELGPLPFLEVHLVQDVKLTSVRSDGKPLPFREFQEGSIVPAGTRGIHWDERGGFLLPGSGWFPQTSAEMEELASHTTTFVLPDGFVGIAAGTRTKDDVWETTIPGRPYAVWGAFEQSETVVEQTPFLLFRRAGASASPPRLAAVAGLLGLLGEDLGEAPGAGAWKLVDVGRGVAAGGLRTLFWDENVASATTGEPAVTMLERDLAGALAAGFWTESLRFRAGTATWLSRGIPLYLGDEAAVALSGSDRLDRESLVIGSRRAAFLEGIESDKPLGDLPATSPDTERVLATRGALVMHLMAEVADSRSAWIRLLAEFRAEQSGKISEGRAFRKKLFDKYDNRHDFLGRFILGTALPDFRIGAHGRVQTEEGERYRVEVENRGEIPGLAILTAFTRDGQPLGHHKAVVDAGAKHPIFLDPNQLGRVALDVRGVSPQSDVTGESVFVRPAGQAE
jgi:hypothetical protein